MLNREIIIIVVVVVVAVVVVAAAAAAAAAAVDDDVIYEVHAHPIKSPRSWQRSSMARLNACEYQRHETSIGASKAARCDHSPTQPIYRCQRPIRRF